MTRNAKGKGIQAAGSIDEAESAASNGDSSRKPKTIFISEWSSQEDVLRLRTESQGAVE